MKFVPEFTGLRGIAALMVFAQHAAFDGLLPEILSTDKEYGGSALMMFFVLSGFLMAQLYLKLNFTRENIKKYLVARTARIFPLYLTVILASLIISNLIYSDFHYDFVEPIKFFTALFAIRAHHELWTIPVEIHFYLCFIIFWFFYSREKKNKIVLILIPILAITPFIYYFLVKREIPHLMPTFAIYFFIGIYISILKNRGTLDKFTSKVPNYISLVILFLFVVNLAGIRFLFNISEIRLVYYFYPLILIFLLFTFVVAKPKTFPILAFKPVVFLGEISYGTYILHRPIMRLMYQYDLHPVLLTLLILIITIILATILYYILEMPAKRFIYKKFIGSLPQIKKE